jgi:CRISPR-associated protein Csd1
MIHALLQYAQDRGLVSKPGYAKKTVKWILDFDASGGRFTGLVKSDKEFSAAPDLSFSELIAIGTQQSQAAHFLIASLGTFLGWNTDEETKDKEIARRETLVWMLREAGKTDSGLDALSRVLVDDQIAQSMRAAVLSTKKPTPKLTDLTTIRFGDRFPVEESTWHEWWDEFRAKLKKPATEQTLMACFGTGELITPETTHPKLKKLSGVGLSQPYAPIITFDKKAFESYGLAQCENAAMGSDTARAYVDALDDLIEKSVVYAWRRPKPKAQRELKTDYARLGGARLAYWYIGPGKAREEVEDHNDLISLMLGSESKNEAPPEDDEEERVLAESRLRQVIDRIRSGKIAQPIGNIRFCVLALSGAGGRVMVRDFFEGTVLHLAETTERWFDDLALVTYLGRPGHPPSLEQVLTAPLSKKGRDQDYLKWVAPAGAWRQSLWRAALTGGRLPGTAFARALLAHNNTIVKGELTDDKEGPAAGRLSHLRLAFVKTYLIRKGVIMKPALDIEHPSPVYHCGRLLAVYDSLQRAALGDVGAGVVQRYYGGALTNPSGVFGQLSRMAQTHLSKLEGGLTNIYENRIAEIHNGIRREGTRPASYPCALNLDDQALFALGFWHQIAATNKEKAEAAAAKRVREENAKNNQSTEKENQ